MPAFETFKTHLEKATFLPNFRKEFDRFFSYWYATNALTALEKLRALSVITKTGHCFGSCIIEFIEEGYHISHETRFT